MNPAQIVIVGTRQLDRFARNAIAESIGFLRLIQHRIEGRPIHRAVEVAELFRPFADEVAHHGPAVELELEALEFLGPVDRMEHACSAQLLGAAFSFHQTIDADQVPQVRFLRMGDLVDAEFEKEIGVLLEALAHGGFLSNVVRHQSLRSWWGFEF